jgi:hypothetical protein
MALPLDFLPIPSSQILIKLTERRAGYLWVLKTFQSNYIGTRHHI